MRSNGGAASNLTSLRLIARMVSLGDLRAILVAIHGLRNLILSAHECQLDGPYWQVELGIDDSVLDVIGSHCPRLESLKVFGESWLTDQSVHSSVRLASHSLSCGKTLTIKHLSFKVARCSSLQELYIEVWGGPSKELLAGTQKKYEGCVAIRCAMVACCPLRPTSAPRMSERWSFDTDGDPSHQRSAIVYPKRHSQYIPTHVCEYCKGNHFAEEAVLAVCTEDGEDSQGAYVCDR
ncbi:hypothetical protein NMY22_g13027 [Coprinellus aureogranulatus]|nr:hypothetical protein NMY22_g13027 [Coprinellus aureogranulatus]